MAKSVTKKAAAKSAALLHWEKPEADWMDKKGGCPI
jgi:hypothetical protein